ncbi:unnamed protein product [Effrenium voratum]|nr:unnamed protein product [Effrenium voratum]
MSSTGVVFCGLAMQAGASLTFLITLTCLQWLDQNGWPTGLLNIGAFTLLSLLLMTELCTDRGARALPTSSRDRAVVFVQGFCSVFGYGGAVLGSRSGCGTDVMAISSINVVTSAALGAILFGNAFGLRMWTALVSTMARAVLITQPQFIFGGEEPPWLGYFFALSCGLGLLGSILASRLSGPEVSLVWSNLSVASQRGCFSLFLALWKHDLDKADKLYETPFIALAAGSDLVLHCGHKGLVRRHAPGTSRAQCHFRHQLRHRSGIPPPGRGLRQGDGWAENSARDSHDVCCAGRLGLKQGRHCQRRERRDPESRYG